MQTLNDIETINQRAEQSALFLFEEKKPMDTAIVCGLISAASAIIVSVITAVYNNKLLMYRIEQLEKKMDKHNNVIERVTALEIKVSDLENDGK